MSEVSEEEPPAMAASKLAGGWNLSLGHSRRRSLRSHVTGRAIVLGGHFLSPDNLHCLVTADKNRQGSPSWACPSASGPRAQGPPARAYLRSRFHFIMLQYPKSRAPMPTANML